MDEVDSWEYQRNCLIPKGEALPEGVNRIAAVVEYDGSAFCGWQRQSHSPSVQQEVEAALSSVAAEEVVVACAGRTDTGVHGTNQIIHFDTYAQRNPRNWVLGANANLPDSVRLHWASQVPAQFHARFSANARTYRYVICNDPYRPALLHAGMTWVRKPLNEQLMQQAAQYLLGEHDFSAFRAAGCQSVSPFRNVHYVELWRQGALVIMEIRANAFLHHMVRNIAGTLITIGSGERSPEWVSDLLKAKNRDMAPPTAPPNGLYLVHVDYPEEFELPNWPPGPNFIANSLQTQIGAPPRFC